MAPAVFRSSASAAMTEGNGAGAGSIPATSPRHFLSVASACAAFASVQSIGLE